MNIFFKHEITSDEIISSQEIVDMLLKNRGITNLQQFLNPPHPDTLFLQDFGYKSELKKTMKLLEKIKAEQKMIVVYTDYDADGITGGAILWETLHLLGFNVMPYVPHRKLEGYGFSIKGIDTVKKKFNPALIISVDHGITAREKVTYAKSIGMPIIITDHHLKPEKLPDDAVAIFHIPALSGSGVSYFFSKAIFEYFAKSLPSSITHHLSSHFDADYLALASIGTVADLVPLTGHSRSIVKHGLAAFSKIKRVGLKHILRESGIEGKPISPYEIGFIIAPRINAIGRLEHAIDALRLLCTTQDEKASLLASRVGKTNRERQDLVTIAVEEAQKIISKMYVRLEDLQTPARVDESVLNIDSQLPKLIILVSDHWNEGIIGLIATKIVDKYYRPTMILTKNTESGKTIYKASARSIADFHMTDFLRSLKKYLIDVGGHAQASGFTIQETKLKQFIKTAEKKADSLITGKMLEHKIEADYKFPLSKLSLTLAHVIEKLQPFGIGNSMPVFYSEGFVRSLTRMGKTQKHMKLLVSETENSNPHEFIYFNGVEKLQKKPTHNQKIALVYTLSINRWLDRERVQGKVLHIMVPS